jgi:ribonuclease BN (tRNA processing enzyme)
MKVKILGCGDAFSSGGRHNTCFYVRSEAGNFLIDCGSSSLASLKSNKLSSQDIDCVFISHFHGDHFAGLPFILLDAAIVQKRKKELFIVSPPGCKERLKKLFDILYPGVYDRIKKLDLRYVEFEAGKSVKLFNNLNFEPFSVNHSAQTLPHGFKITIGNKSLGYSGDTGWTDTLFDIAKDTDAFICECNFKHTLIPGHLSYDKLKDNLLNFKTKRIILTHLGEEMLGYDPSGNVELAYDGMEVEL